MKNRQNDLTGRPTPENRSVSKGSARDSSFELLRIISILAIVFCHFATHGGFDYAQETLSIPRFWLCFLEMGGNFGVNVFVLISGYFLIMSHDSTFNWRKVLKLWGQVFFYSVLIYVVFGLTKISDFSLPSLVKTLFPITFENWWFASTYLVLYLFHPFLNRFLRKLDKQSFQKLLVLLILLWCLIPTFTFSSFQSNDLLWFVTLYCIAGYIRLYDLNPAFHVRHYTCFWLVFSALRYLSAVVLLLTGIKAAFAAGNPYALFYGKKSVLTLLSALSLFMVFKNIKMGTRKGINVVASATFGVYLIHDSSIVRPFLWNTVFKTETYQDSAFLILYSIGVCLLVYAACTVIDLLRQNTIEKVYLHVVNKIAPVILSPFAALIGFGKRIVFGKQDD